MGKNNVVGKFVEPFTNREVARIKRALIKNNEKRNFCLFVLGINQGLRTTELLNLKIADVQNAQIGDSICLTEQKTGKDNYIYINNVSFAAIQNYLNTIYEYETEDYLFKSRSGNKAITGHQLGRLIKDWCKYARIKDASKYGTRSLRKTFATMNYELSENKNIMESLGQRFNHCSVPSVLPYLGTRQQTPNNIDLFWDK